MTEEPLKALTQTDLIEIIDILSKLSDDSLDTRLTQECKDFLKSPVLDLDPLRFIRDLLDKCVRYGAASGKTVSLLEEINNRFPPESEEEKEKRRQEILKGKT